jgi:hypothetical protein
MRKTKPNLGRMGHLGDAVPGRGRSCKTKPIPRQRQAGRSPGAGDAGQLRQTNPICRGRAENTIVKAKGLGDMPPVTGARARNKANSSPGPALAGARRPKRTQFGWSDGGPEREMRKTNPIPRQRRAGRGLGDEVCCTNKPNSRVMPIRRSAFPGRAVLRQRLVARCRSGNKANPLEPIVRNKPNLAGRVGLRRAKCAKQSQTWAGWDIWGTPCQGEGDCTKRTKFPGSAGRGRARGVRDAGKLRQTNPIWPGSGKTPTGKKCETNPIPARPGGTRLGGRDTPPFH